jgi:hypothetical protein
MKMISKWDLWRIINMTIKIYIIRSALRPLRKAKKQKGQYELFGENDRRLDL